MNLRPRRNLWEGMVRRRNQWGTFQNSCSRRTLRRRPHWWRLAATPPFAKLSSTLWRRSRMTGSSPSMPSSLRFQKLCKLLRSSRLGSRSSIRRTSCLAILCLLTRKRMLKGSLSLWGSGLVSPSLSRGTSSMSPTWLVTRNLSQGLSCLNQTERRLLRKRSRRMWDLIPRRREDRARLSTQGQDYPPQKWESRQNWSLEKDRKY